MMNTTPEKLARMTNKQATSFLFQLIERAEKQGKRGTNTFSLVKGVKSWWLHNDIIPTRTPYIEGSNHYNKYQNEVPPDQGELDKILRTGDLRSRAAIAILAFSGVREGVLGHYLGRDGLRISDIPDLKITKDDIRFENVPALIKVRQPLSKKKNPYFTFIPEQGCDYVREYLEYRRTRLGEVLTPDSAVITSDPHNAQERADGRWKPHGQPIRSTNIGDMVRKTIRKAGYSWRPHVLRRYFDMRMLKAELDHLVSKSERQFWMGHRGDMEATYTVDKGINPDILEQMRESYRKAAEKHLVTTHKESTEDVMTQRMNHRFLRYAGYSEEQIAELGDLSKLTEDQMMDLVNQRSMASLGLNGNHQKVVQMLDVKPYITQGWEFVSALPSGEAIIRLPRLNQ